MKKARLIALLMTLCMATACFLSGTVAKYTSSSEGSGTYEIAAWEFEINDINIAQTSAQTFAIALEDTLDTDSTDTDADDEVASNKIAPGTTGSFKIVLENTSDVDATYDIEYNVPQFGGQTIPFTYSVSTQVGSNTAVVTDSLADVTDKPIASGETVTIVVTWTWAYEHATDNAIDTAIGIAAATNSDFVITADVTVTQAN